MPAIFINHIFQHRLWKTYGAQVQVTTADITTESGCEEAINEASHLGPVTAIFNLAVALRDGIFENLDMKMFEESLAPKAAATRNLDLVSRKLCPQLKHFVVFSSFSCGRGNAGQSNYGLANSIMERIVEERSDLGLPAKAIQWAAVGDVGLLAEFQLNNLDKDFKGTLPQAISSCLEVLDVLLTSDDTIVSSMVVADKTIGDVKKGNIIDMILKIMGIRDRKSISMDSTLTQLGIDSLMGVEIQQILERDFDIALTSQELRSLTLGQLEKRAVSGGESESEENRAATEAQWMKLLTDGVINKETKQLHTSDTIVKANDIEADNGTKVLIIPGFYGTAADVYRNIAKEMDYPTFILQLIESSECADIEAILEMIKPHILNLYSDCNNFVLVAHSFGAVLSLNIAHILESNGKKGKIIQLDGSPQFINKFALKMSPDKSVDKIRATISMILFDAFMSYADPKVVKASFQEHEEWEERVDAMLKNSADKIPYTFEFIKTFIFTALVNRFNIVLNLKEDSFSALDSTQISLIRAIKSSVNGLQRDFGLSKYTSEPIKIQMLEGDHVTLLTNSQLLSVIKGLLS
jgi:fatty acid synthase